MDDQTKRGLQGIAGDAEMLQGYIKNNSLRSEANQKTLDDRLAQLAKDARALADGYTDDDEESNLRQEPNTEAGTGTSKTGKGGKGK